MNVHIVQRGDTLWKIAKQYQIPFDELKRLNAHLANPDYIVPGMEIILPEMMSAPAPRKEAPAKQTLPLTKPKEQPIQKEQPVQKEQTKQPVMPVPAPIPVPAPRPSIVPIPQMIPMPYPMPQPQATPIYITTPEMPTTTNHTIHIQQPQQPQQPMPIQHLPMQCPSCQMTLFIALQEQEKDEKKDEKRIDQKPVEPALSCSNPQPVMPMCGGSCNWPMPAFPAHHQPAVWPAHQCPSCQQLYPPQFMPPMMGQSPTQMMPTVEMPRQQWFPAQPMALEQNCSSQQQLKCEMQDHIVNEYFEEIREIERNPRPCFYNNEQPFPMPPPYAQ